MRQLNNLKGYRLENWKTKKEKHKQIDTNQTHPRSPTPIQSINQKSSFSEKLGKLDILNNIQEIWNYICPW